MPKWLKLYRNLNTYGTKAVFGRSVLHVFEMDAMNITNNIVSSFEAREAAKDWSKWEENNPKAASILAWAAEQYKAFEETWQSEYR